MKKDVIERLAPQVGRLDEDADVLNEFGLSRKILNGLRPYRIFILTVLRTQVIGWPHM
jgi:hypothetical protein